MIENPLPISLINDFIFCPASIYFHMVDASLDKLSYASIEQIDGLSVHNTIDNSTYSDKTSVLQSISVYSSKYNLYGKIDTFDTSTGVLTERKRKITEIYDGFIFQLYSYYFSLTEMNYNVKTLRLYSMTDNKSYYIPLPDEDEEMMSKFKAILKEMQNFNIEYFFQSSKKKCLKCVYEPLCSYSNTI